MTNEPTAFDEPTPGTYDEPDGQAGSVDLTAFDEDYEQAEAPDFEEVPDGKYQVRVLKAQLGESRKGDPMLKWDLVVLSGPHAGRHIFKNAVITRDSIPFVKGDLKTLGLALTRFSDLPAHLEELLDKTVEITKRTKGEFTNVYFNRLIELPEGISDAAAPF